MTENAQPAWATEIQNEIGNTKTAIHLVAGILKVGPLMKHIADFLPKNPRDETPGAVREQISRLNSGVKELDNMISMLGNSSVGSIESAKVELFQVAKKCSGDPNLVTFIVRNTATYGFPGLKSDLKSLSTILGHVADSISVKRGQPRAATRGLIISLIGECFRKNVPGLELGHTPTSLFYKVVNQYLEDLDVDQGNLGRTIKQKFPGGKLRQS